MKPSNYPEIGIAQEWLEEISAWVDRQGLRGFEPDDLWRHPWLVELRPYPLAQQAVEILCDIFPYTSRHILGIEPTEDTESHALVALGKLRHFELSQDERFLDAALQHLEWVQQKAAPDIQGLGWSNAQGRPTWAATTTMADAFFLAHATTKKDVYLEQAQRITDFILLDLPRTTESDDTACFGAGVADARRVHHGNLGAALHLLKVSRLTGKTELAEVAEPAIQFTVKRQRPDGAWHFGEYAGENSPPRETPDRIAHHPNATILHALYQIQALRPEQDIESALRCGFSYYYQNLLVDRQMPKQSDSASPVDIRDCASAILCCTALAPLFAPAERAAIAALRWTWTHLRAANTAELHYRKYRWFTSRITFPGWGVASMYHAVAEYLHHFLGKTTKAAEGD